MKFAKLRIEQIVEDPKTLRVTTETDTALIVSDFKLVSSFEHVAQGEQPPRVITRHRRELDAVLTLPHESFDLVVIGEDEEAQAVNPVSLTNTARVIIAIPNLQYLQTAQIKLNDPNVSVSGREDLPDLATRFFELRARDLKYDLVIGLTPDSYELNLGHWQRGE